MPSFSLISDVFCPWCYGFGPVTARLIARHPDFSLQVLVGNLIDAQMSIADLLEEMPGAQKFFERLQETTGRRIGPSFLRQIQDRQQNLVMHSPSVARALTCLAELQPGRAFEHLDAFQQAFFGQGQDVLALRTQLAIAAQFNVKQQDYERLLAEPSLLAKAEKQAEQAEQIMGEFLLYPTLYLLDDQGERHLLARGYQDYELVAAELDLALRRQAQPGPISGPACALNGNCG